MAEDLLETALAGGGEAAPATPAAPQRPDGVPEKFWDAERGAVRLEALLKSYRELERRLSQRFAPPPEDAPEEEKRRFRRALGVPERPEDYAIEPRHELCGPDPEINARLHAAGFTCAQAQLVYDLAAERLLPLLAEAAQALETERALDRLRAHFGGEERFRRVAAQLSAWGKANLPASAFEALASTYEGVLALQSMMEKGEPALAREAEGGDAPDEAALRALMRDPRYWRTREPEFVRRVTEGFRRLVGGGA
ncbi:capsid assembly protein [Caldovatus aquaticus]|uniref:Uncharacterized protein n=1 Tax=Caldovatus aquaticus TaxID=2865671 RepID=A0ABS7F5U8_9PROT|nr:hypothetical protein [Caldovatus aquaticus]MBW8270688.1 hypothetical protein [Caldovatus aquaticus]